MRVAERGGCQLSDWYHINELPPQPGAQTHTHTHSGGCSGSSGIETIVQEIYARSIVCSFNSWKEGMTRRILVAQVQV